MTSAFTFLMNPADDDLHLASFFLYCLFWIKEENELENGAHFSGFFLYTCVCVCLWVVYMCVNSFSTDRRLRASEVLCLVDC